MIYFTTTGLYTVRNRTAVQPIKIMELFFRPQISVAISPMAKRTGYQQGPQYNFIQAPTNFIPSSSIVIPPILPLLSTMQPD